jgi:hypothetical protein
VLTHVRYLYFTRNNRSKLIKLLILRYNNWNIQQYVIYHSYLQLKLLIKFYFFQMLSFCNMITFEIGVRIAVRYSRSYDCLCGQGSWLQKQRSGFDSRRYWIWEVVGLERRLSLVSKIEELLGRKNSCSGQEYRDYGRRDQLRWPCDTPLPTKIYIDFAYKLQSLGLKSSLADWSHEGTVDNIRYSKCKTTSSSICIKWRSLVALNIFNKPSVLFDAMSQNALQMVEIC